VTKNVGTVDRIIRVVIGIVLLSLLFLLKGNARWLGLIGIIPLGTAAISSCPIYSLLRIRTCPAAKPADQSR
jgi:hypothetical protein